MPTTRLVIYQDMDGAAPLLDWLSEQTDRVRAKCRSKLERLRQFGNELRRPDCDYLRNGIYELRARDGNVHYRILYGFVGQHIVLLSHGCTKERAIPNREIERAVKNLAMFKGNPVAHTAQGGF